MPPEKTESITIRLPAGLRQQIETAAAAEKRSTSSFIEVALEKYLKSSGYIPEDTHPDRKYNVRGRWLDVSRSHNPFPGKGLPNLVVTTPNEPDFIFGANDMESLLTTASAAFDGIEYGRKNPKTVAYDPTKDGQ